jgi:hypothetical protein
MYSANLPAKITGFQRLRFLNAAGEGDCGPDASKQHAHHAAATTSGGLSGACNVFLLQNDIKNGYPNDRWGLTMKNCDLMEFKGI